jgi:hypothetical protein
MFPAGQVSEKVEKKSSVHGLVRWHNKRILYMQDTLNFIVD